MLYRLSHSAVTTDMLLQLFVGLWQFTMQGFLFYSAFGYRCLLSSAFLLVFVTSGVL